MPGSFEIRCPIYGFIQLDAWEREIIEQPAFQRLRRIRQLAWTDSVYPGAMHTRFEHSLGVMHMSSLLFDGIAERSWKVLSDKHGYQPSGRDRYRQLVRLAALLHDVGHGPFSHAAEDLMPMNGNKPYLHEEYSTAIIRKHFKDVIENHNSNNNYQFSVEEVAGLVEGGTAARKATLWQEIISGQLDADRMDYLLRDSYHSGVEYGKYDWRRIVSTAELVPDPDSGTLRLGVSESGRHAAEGLIIARYMMFNQVYFHKTRVILDFHLREAVKAMLPGGVFPSPSDKDIDSYLNWDDWKVLGNLSNGQGGEHGLRLITRNFYRQCWETPEFPKKDDAKDLFEVETALGSLVAAKRDASKSWYKVGIPDLPILLSSGISVPLSECSTIVGNMQPTRRTRLYVDKADRERARKIITDLKGGKNAA